MTDTHTRKTDIADTSADQLADGLIDLGDDAKTEYSDPANNPTMRVGRKDGLHRDYPKYMSQKAIDHFEDTDRLIEEGTKGAVAVKKAKEKSAGEQLTIPPFLDRRNKMEQFLEAFRDLVEQAGKHGKFKEYYMDSRQFGKLLGVMHRWIGDVFEEAGIVWHADGVAMIKRVCEHVIRHHCSIRQEDGSMVSEIYYVSSKTGEIDPGMSSDELFELDMEERDILRCVSDLVREGALEDDSEDSDLVIECKARIKTWMERK